MAPPLRLVRQGGPIGRSLLALAVAGVATPGTSLAARAPRGRTAVVPDRTAASADPPTANSATPASPGDAWYTSTAGAVEGPFVRSQIFDKYASGEILRETLVYHQGASWQALAATADNLDAWMLRSGSEVVGPITSAVLLDQIELVSAAQSSTAFEVRHADGATWLPLIRAVGLRPSAPPAPSVPRAVDVEAPDEVPRRTWEERPPSGVGLVVSGSVVLAVGSIQTLVGVGLASARSATSPKYQPYVWAPMIVVGLLHLAAGAPLLAAGATRHRRYEDFRRKNGLTIAPQPAADLSGVSLSVAGRF